MRLPSRQLTLLTSAAFAATVALAPSVAHPNDLPHAVLAYYYVWYDEGSFNSALFQPLQPYNSDDLGVMQRHVDQAKTAGIDGFIVDWYGNGDRTDANLGHLMDVAEKSGFSATIHFETPHFWGADDVTAQLKAFYDHYAGRPGMVR